MSNCQHITAEELYPSANIIGEGPVWHAVRSSFFWVDIEGKKLHEMKWPARQVKVWDMPQRIGMAAVAEDGNLIVALQAGLARFNVDTEVLERLIDIEKEVESNRANDGKCDSKGRLWLGTMDLQATQSKGSLYCIAGRNITRHLDSLSIANGMAWSLDDSVFYFIDSAQRKIDAYLFDASQGSIAFEKTVVEVPEAMGLPDGLCIDVEGMLWVAHWGGNCVGRWNPKTGELLARIDLPVSQVSSCAFGGENLDQLFISTARVGLSADELLKYPASGHVFIAAPRVKGLVPNLYKEAY